MLIWSNILGCQPHTSCCFGSELRKQDTRRISDGNKSGVTRRRHKTTQGRSVRGEWRRTPLLIARHHGQLGIGAVAVQIRIPAVAVRTSGESNRRRQTREKDLDAKGANGGDAHSADAFFRSGDGRCFLFTRSGGKAGDAEGNSGSRSRASRAEYLWLL